MEGEDITVYTKNSSLIIDSRIIKIREIIAYKSIEDIIITHVNETYDNEMLIFLSKNIEYENIGKYFFHKILYLIYLFFHRTRNRITISYSNSDLLLILDEVKNNLSNVNIPTSLDKSLFWNENSNSFNCSQVKLIYSKNNLSLSDVLKKYNKIKEI